MGHAQDRKTVQTIGSEFQVQDYITQIIVQWRPDWRIVGQHDDAQVVVAQPQLNGGTDHPLGLNATYLGGFQGLVPLGVGVIDIGPHLGEADVLFGGDVGSAADDFQLLGASADHTEAQPVGVGMRADVGHMADVDLAPASDDLDLADLDAGHGQPVGQLLGRQVNIHILLEPGNGHFHLYISCYGKKRALARL